MLSQSAYFDWSFKIKIEMKGEVNCQDIRAPTIGGKKKDRANKLVRRNLLQDDLVWFGLVIFIITC